MVTCILIMTRISPIKWLTRFLNIARRKKRIQLGINCHKKIYSHLKIHQSEDLLLYLRILSDSGDLRTILDTR